MKRFIPIVTAVLSLGLLAGCGAKPTPSAPASAPAATTAPAPAAQPITLKVGVTAGPHEQIVRDLAPRLAKEGINLDIHVFTDYKIPNQALENKELDVNIFQHQPYLDAENKNRGFHIVSVGKAVTFPMGAYSQKVKKLDDLKEGATVAIPNDATNGGRALLVLQQAGLIKVNASAGVTAGPKDVTDNPKKLKFKELDAAMLVRALPDVDAAVINTNYIIDAKMDPTKDAIFTEQNSPYVNIIAVRQDEKDLPWVQTLVKAYQSPETKDFINKTFHGAVVVGWE